MDDADRTDLHGLLLDDLSLPGFIYSSEETAQGRTIMFENICDDPFDPCSKKP